VGREDVAEQQILDHLKFDSETRQVNVRARVAARPDQVRKLCLALLIKQFSCEATVDPDEPVPR